ncbi:MAG TPA: DNA (cytosine-5-)-methyltransferase [bacterium]
MMTTKTDRVLTYGELFCGPGGMACGATQVKAHSAHGRTYRIEHTWASDIDLDACKTYRRNICPEDPDSVYHSDVRKLKFTQLRSVDILAFGFPCNDFSTLGEQRGLKGNYGSLYKHAARALKYFRPMFFVAENVHGLKLLSNGDGLSAVFKEFAAAGYKLVPHLYHFEDYGVPQARHRIIIVGVRSDLKHTFKIPAPTHHKHVSCKHALEKYPIKPDTPNHERTIQSQTVIDRLSHIKPGENAWNANLPRHLKLHVKGAWISQIYRRLDSRLPSYTVTGSGGGGTHVYHWKENRALTNREKARLQTFTDKFVFEGKKDSVRRQVGMAVPPRAAKVIFRAILNTIAGVPYRSVETNLPHITPQPQKR